MKYLGVKVPKRSEWHGEFDWYDRPAYILCPADDPDKQIQCLEYEPCIEHNWQCKHCGCGSSDICTIQ